MYSSVCFGRYYVFGGENPLPSSPDITPSPLCALSKCYQTKEKALREEMAANKEREAKENAKSRKGMAKPKKVSDGEKAREDWHQGRG